MSIRRFLDAFLFSQLAYLGYIYHLKYFVTGINAFLRGVYFWFLDIPLLLISIPLSLFLFRKRLEKTKLEKLDDHENEKSRQLIIDYLVFWGITLGCAVLFYYLHF
jgi:hypothetical protein